MRYVVQADKRAVRYPGNYQEIRRASCTMPRNNPQIFGARGKVNIHCGRERRQ